MSLAWEPWVWRATPRNDLLFVSEGQRSRSRDAENEVGGRMDRRHSRPLCVE